MARTVRLLRVGEPADRYASLFLAARERGVRLGWLEIGERPATPLDPVVESGAARAVTLDRHGSVAVKRTAGPPVLRDVLREHFLGCAAVLVHVVGEAPESIVLDDVPELRTNGETLTLGGARPVRNLSPERLVELLGRPGFWAAR